MNTYSTLKRVRKRKLKTEQYGLLIIEALEILDDDRYYQLFFFQLVLNRYLISRISDIGYHIFRDQDSSKNVITTLINTKQETQTIFFSGYETV